jgi:hypothetical protein
MFVQSCARHRSDREDPADIMNDREPFFPLETDQGETLLIAKARVVELVGDLPSRRLDAAGIAAPGVTVAITLVGGTVRTGSLHLDTPGPAPRPLDFLNHSSERFLALHESLGVRLINRDLIERVHPLD